MLPIRLYTTKIPHHSAHSGYEQLVRFIPERSVFAAARINNRSGWRRQVERVVRRVAANRWYMWDGIQSEWNAFKSDRKQPSIHHFLYGDHTIGWLPYVRRFMRGPLVLTIHACPSDLPEVIQYPSLLKKIDHLILLGGNQAPFFLKNGISQDRLTVVHHGVDVDFFKPDLRVKGDRKTVLIAGNWRRNFPFYRQMIERMPDFHFRVLTARHNFNWFDGYPGKNLTLLSDLSDQQLLQEYRSAGAMLLSVTDAVANNVLLEALACGLPVVAEKTGALPEYLGEGYPFLFEPEDYAAAGGMLRQALENPADRRTFTEIAGKKSWHNVANETAAVYRNIRPLYQV